MTSPAQIIQSGGDLVAQFLGACGVLHVFGVISVHNLPILDAIQRHGSIRYVPARSEAGAVNMADGYARVSGGLGRSSYAVAMRTSRSLCMHLDKTLHVTAQQSPEHIVWKSAQMIRKYSSFRSIFALH